LGTFILERIELIQHLSWTEMGISILDPHRYHCGNSSSQVIQGLLVHADDERKSFLGCSYFPLSRALKHTITLVLSLNLKYDTKPLTG